MGTAFLNKNQQLFLGSCAPTLHLLLSFSKVPKEQAQEQSSKKGSIPVSAPIGTRVELPGKNHGWCPFCSNLCYYQIFIWHINNTCFFIVAFHYLHFNILTTGRTWKILILQFGKYFYNNHSPALGQGLHVLLQKVSCWDVWTMACQTVLAWAQKNKLLSSHNTRCTLPCQKFSE